MLMMVNLKNCKSVNEYPYTVSRCGLTYRGIPLLIALERFFLVKFVSVI